MCLYISEIECTDYDFTTCITLVAVIPYQSGTIVRMAVIKAQGTRCKRMRFFLYP